MAAILVLLIVIIYGKHILITLAILSILYGIYLTR